MKSPKTYRTNFVGPSCSLKTVLLASFGLLGLFAIQSACVTVNVNFPEGAVQKATDDYVRDLYRTRKTDDMESGDTGQNPILFHLFPTAWADETIKPFNLQDPNIQALQKSQRGRIGSILTYKKQGYIGETSEGLLTLKNEGPLDSKPLLKKKVQKLVKDENQDRNKLYEIALTSNGMDSGNMSKVQQSFSRSFQGESPSGTWVQSPSGTWSQKP